MRARLYVDTSAYLCILLGEPGWEKISPGLSEGLLLSSSLLVLEVQRTLVRLSREGGLAPGDFQRCMERLDADLEGFSLRDLTIDLCRSRVMPLVSIPRSLDLAHLRTAAWFHAQEPLDRFVSLDEAQRQGARELGLPV